MSPHFRSRIEIAYSIGEKEHRTYFQTNDLLLREIEETHLTATLTPSMRVGAPVRLSSSVSDRLLSAVPRIQDILLRWDQSLERIEVLHSDVTRSIGSTEGRVGVFFSAGVDSFYTFLKHREEITDLIFVQGFDVGFNNPTLIEQSAAGVREVAESMKKGVVEIHTDLRQVIFDPYVKWGVLGHGAALATIGHLLSPWFRRVYVASSREYDGLVPWGTHPLLDALWSSESLEFVHDGCEASRIEKLEEISQSAIALNNLRTCFMNPRDGVNCGTCEKCVRTMLGLKAVGALEGCSTFRRELTPRAIRHLGYLAPVQRHFMMENLRALGDQPGSEALVRAAKKCVRRSIWKEMIRKDLEEFHPRLHESAVKLLRSMRGS